MRLAASLCFFAGFALAQHNSPPADIEDGKRLFETNCIACHGPDGNMVEGIDLGHGKFRRASSDESLMKIIQQGIAGTAMPPHSFSDHQAGTVVAYLRSMAAAGRVKSGDPSRGKQIFSAQGCAGCHRVNGDGSRTGPDLTEIGLARRSVELERSIADPKRDALLQNRSYRVVTRDGQAITGRLLNQDSFTVQLLDSKERLRSLQRSNLREWGFVDGSPMPSYRGKLSQGELDDLVAYLVSLKGGSTTP